MEHVINALRRRLYKGDHELLMFQDELSRLKHNIKSLVSDGESNSILIVGRRGVGKKRALKEMKRDPSIQNNLLEVHLNGEPPVQTLTISFSGLVHTDDRSALRSMAKQLHRESLLDETCSESSAIEEDGLKSLPFSQHLQWFLDGLRSGEGLSKSLLIVLHEFDLFALHRNQILLYNLFDCCQCNDTPIGVIGLTCRLDIMELLEKRVKSRFSHRQIHLTSIVSPIDCTGSFIDQGNVDGDGPETVVNSSAFNAFCLACKHLLTISSDYVLANMGPSVAIGGSKERRCVEDGVRVWNEHVCALLTDEIVVDTLRQAWSVSVSLRRLVNLLTPIVSRLGSNKFQIEPVEFIDSLCALRQDAKVNALKGLCVLELFLIATLVKWQEITEGELSNLEVLFAEYTKFCRSNCPGYLYEKTVVAKLLDGLIDLELVVCGKAAVTAATVSTAGRRAIITGSGGAAGLLPNYRPLYCFVDAASLSACLDAYPNCPVELQFWIHSRTF